MKNKQQSTCNMLCPRLSAILPLSILFIMTMKFYKYFEFVQSFHTSAFAGKSLVTNKFTSQLSSDTAINIDDQMARHNVANASYSDARREENKTTVSEVSITDRYETYLIYNDRTCSGVNESLVVVLVHTAVANFERRKLIRNTWGNIRLSMLENHPMRVVFLLGKPGKEQLQTAINLENVQHGDIVQGKFLDTYHNLQYKAILGLRWVTENCRQAKFVLKVDDDVVINTPRLLTLLATKYAYANRTIFCMQVRPKGTSAIERNGKWKVENALFQNLTHWPVKYCPGRFLVYTADLIKELLAAVDTTPLLWLDDVYVTGLLAGKVGNVKHLNFKDISLQVVWLENAHTTRLLNTWNRFSNL